MSVVGLRQLARLQFHQRSWAGGKCKASPESCPFLGCRPIFEALGATGGRLL
jgi:hypothetical protein